MVQEKERRTAAGLLMLVIFLIILVVAALGVFRAARVGDMVGVVAFVVVLVVDVFMATGLFTVAPNEGQVLQLFGAYRGTARDNGLRWANPFYSKRRISLRVRNFESGQLKVNDTDGNPIDIAAVVVWRVIDTAEAVFEVDDSIHPLQNSLLEFVCHSRLLCYEFFTIWNTGTHSLQSEYHYMHQYYPAHMKYIYIERGICFNNKIAEFNQNKFT